MKIKETLRNGGGGPLRVPSPRTASQSKVPGKNSFAENCNCLAPYRGLLVEVGVPMGAIQPPVIALLESLWQTPAFPAVSRENPVVLTAWLMHGCYLLPFSLADFSIRHPFRRQPLAMIGALLLVLFVGIALFAPWISPFNPAAIDLNHRLVRPDHIHWFGTDELGRDIFSRTLYGARLSLLVATSVVACSLFLGLIFGGLAGYYGGAVDTALNTFLMNAFLALPGILLAIAFVAFLGPGIINLVLALSIGGWVGYARLVRAQVLAAREREFVEAARALGASDLRIFVRHILPNIMQPVIVQAAIGMAGAVLAEATLSFLGLGVPPPAASWGAMLNDARSHLFDAPHLVVFPAIAVMLCVLSFNFLGDALRDYLDPRTRMSVGL